MAQHGDGEHQLLEPASTDSTLTQNAYTASLSQQMASLEEIAESIMPAQTTPSTSTNHLPNFQEDEDLACSFIAFEKIAQQAGWPRSEWGRRLAPFLPGKLQAAYQTSNPSGTAPYAEVKQALLEWWRLDSEEHRLQLRKERLQAEDTPQELCCRIQAQLNRWLQPAQYTKEQMLDLLCLEQFVSGLPTHIQTQVKQHPGLTIQKAVRLATLFQLEQTPQHSSINGDPSVPQPLSQGNRNSRIQGTKEAHRRVQRALWPSADACPQRQTEEVMEIEDSGILPSSAIEPFIKTFIFLDLETTGLPKDRPKVTELCLVAVHHTSLEDPVRHSTTGHLQLPRIMDKLCLIIDPGKRVTPKAAEMTGLNNSNLEENEKPNFEEHTLTLVQNFLQRQTQPVCLVAHNGYDFDFPLLKTELQLQGRELPGSVYCLDTRQALEELDLHPGSYSLPFLYKYYFQEEPKDSHYAEGDVMTMLLIFLCKYRVLLEYARTNARFWTVVEPMYTPCFPPTP